MEKFWAVILIFVVVAAAGLMYVNQVYIPQKETQMAMAETANQTLTAVKAEMENDDTPTVVSAQTVLQTVKMYCDKPSNTVKLIVTVNGVSKEYINSYADLETHVGSTTKSFIRKPLVENGILKSIEFSEI